MPIPNALRRQRRRDANLCERCGKEPPKQDCHTGENCIRREAAGVERRRKARVAAN